MLLKRVRKEPWKDAIGVLPVDIVLAEEHDLMHGDDVCARQAAEVPVEIEPTHLRDLPAIQRALRDARRHEDARLQTGKSEGETPLDRTLAFVLGPPAPEGKPETPLRSALDAYEKARKGATLVGLPDSTENVQAAEEAFRAAFCARLNELLKLKLYEEKCFAHLVAAGVIDALGEGEPDALASRANRLLLEATFPSTLARLRDLRLAVLYASVRKTETAALCLSGGGIRSATFALGVLRGFARRGLLGKFDYVSTVSGGGYIGSWLSAWMRHSGPTSVQDELKRASEEKLTPEPEPLRHLRAYSRYLSPRAGLMSADSWTLAATILRNMLLNWMVLLPLLAAGVLLPRILTELLRLPDAGFFHGSSFSNPAASLGKLLTWLIIVGVVLGTVGIAWLHRARAGVTGAAEVLRGRGKWVALGALAIAITLLVIDIRLVILVSESPFFSMLRRLTWLSDAPCVTVGTVEMCRPSFLSQTWLSLFFAVLLGTVVVRLVPRTGGTRVATQRGFLLWCLLPIVLSVGLLSGAWYVWWTFVSSGGYTELFWGLASFANEAPLARRQAINPGDNLASTFLAIQRAPYLVYLLVVLATVIHFVGWYAGAGNRRGALREALPMVFSGFVAGVIGLMFALWFVVRPAPADPEAFYVTFAVPAFLAMILAGSQLFTGWTSGSSTPAEREWAARFNAWLLITILAWTGFCALVLYGPTLLEDAVQKRILAAVGGVSGLITIFLGASARTRSTGNIDTSAPRISGARRFALSMAAPAFAAAIVIGISATNQRLLRMVCSVPSVTGCIPAAPDETMLRRLHPLHEVARDRTRQMEQVGRAMIEPTGADQRLRAAVRSIDFRTLSQHVSRPTEESAVRVARLLDSAATAVEEHVGEALRADAQFTRTSAWFTQLALRADSALVQAGGGDEDLWRTFHLRDSVVHEIDSLLVYRLVNRDTLIIQNMAIGGVLSGLLAKRDSIPPFDSLLARRSARIQSALRTRLESTIAVETGIRRDSVTRDSSLAHTDAVLREIEEKIPGPSAVTATAIGLFIALLILGWYMGRRINTNEFSLHGMYHSRIVRAFLGASRPAGDRDPHPFTGFDPGDDLPMSKLWPAGLMPIRKPKPGRLETQPPMHVVNVALNLVAGTNLAWQQRKAQSMSVSPLHAGAAFLGYRRTSAKAAPPKPGTRGSGDVSAVADVKLYGGRDGITLGTAVTISGAAASPNSGYHSSPLVTFLMTLFNARLGWWLGNPGVAGKDSFHLSSPTQKIKPILDEMFGQTTDHSRYVYLSDGGHFENLGLYEMVLRRCRFIVVSDAGCDPNATFDDLGNAVRKIRVDLGIEIDFDDLDVRKRNVGTGKYWAIGRVRYSAMDMQDRDGNADDYDGVLIYIKPAVYGGEPRDVVNYAETSPTFPHESTTDQFFTESQFESYRELGEFIVRNLLDSEMPATPKPIAGQRRGSLLARWPKLTDPTADIPPVRVPTGTSYPPGAVTPATHS